LAGSIKAQQLNRNNVPKVQYQRYPKQHIHVLTFVSNEEFAILRSTRNLRCARVSEDWLGGRSQPRSFCFLFETNSLADVGFLHEAELRQG
jgi:hypothetical protein